MSYEKFLEEAKACEKEFIVARRYLHAHAEIGFSLPRAHSFVHAKLHSFGLDPKKCGKAGITAELGTHGRCILLRADMDALPMREQTGLDFACENGNMHACGHDMHTAMLLCAAKLLKEHEQELCGRVRLVFQPAEEILAGAKDMIDAGVLEEPRPDAAVMLHVLAGVPLDTGTVIVPDGGAQAPAADRFEIRIHGRACHGSAPQNGVDALSVAAHTVVALQEIAAREMPMGERALFTLGKITAGDAAGIIAGEALLCGTLRAFSEERRETLKRRISEISRAVAAAFRAQAEVAFGEGCPVLVNDGRLCACARRYVRELFGERAQADQRLLPDSVGGSEDFAYIAQRVPALMISLAAGKNEHPLHHPKVIFDESAIALGGALYAYVAARIAEEGF